MLRGIQEPLYDGVAKLICGGASHLMGPQSWEADLTVKYLEKRRKKYEIIMILQEISAKVTLLHICNCGGTIRCTLCVNMAIKEVLEAISWKLARQV